jgi:Asp-tRNA(Asn)/Glu-tRNA(Gln) amidotransferase A subunit family amidase
VGGEAADGGGGRVVSDIAYLSATEALQRFRDRSLSPVELAQALIDRAADVEPTVNALCVTRYEEALAEARAAEDRYMGKGEPPRALEGICVGIKDEVPIAGHPCSGGSLLAKDEIATTTDPMAERILAAGGIPHARTTTPEFSCAGFTHTRLWGVTRNPWNPEYAVGGSSGGTGASLASGTSTLATGSDIGGSIRIPAGWNGVVGFKPPYGRVPQLPPFNMDHYCHNGPLARTVADCALFENVMAGPHPADAAAIAPKYELPARFDGIERLRLGLCIRPGDWPVDDDVAAAVRDAAATLADCGAVVEEIELPSFRPEHVMELSSVHLALIMGQSMELAMEQRDQLCAYTVDLMEQALEGKTVGQVYAGIVGETALHAELEAVHASFDAVLCPVNAARGLIAGDDYVGHTLEIGGVTVPDYFWACLTIPFNICSRNPVLVVPAGFATNGLPVGVQIVGRRYDDLTPLRVGAALERVRPWLDVPERRPMQVAVA